MVAESTTQQKRRWTYSELAALDNEVRYELYDGEVVEMTSPTLLHQQIVLRLAFLLESWAREQSIGRLYLSPIDLYISETRCFVPDLCFYRQERLESAEIEHSDGRCLIAPPDLVVEIISPSTARNDRVKKFNAYAKFGVLHYWLIDPEEKTLMALTLTNGGYLAEASLSDEDTFEPSLFAGSTINLAELFEA